LSTKIEFKSGFVVIDSSDKETELKLGEAVLKAVVPQKKVYAGWDISKFLERTKRHETQYGILRLLIEAGTVNRKQMIVAGGFDGPANLAGCRGSMTQNAIACGLPKAWWTDEYKDGTVLTTIKEEIREAIAEVI
jgi:hypothetical protein